MAKAVIGRPFYAILAAPVGRAQLCRVEIVGLELPDVSLNL
ncbi:hypothetical protein OK016_10695 [Vibrio chagasii]|nr:hypothetical protein [Vibrio chagasii]